MNFIDIKIIIRRFFELLLTNAIISAIITVLNVAGLLNTKITLLCGLLAGIALFIIINVRMLRNCYFDLRSNLLYYITNISAYLIFAAVSFAVYLLCSNECFTWLFAITKFARYTNAEPAAPYSALIFHAIGLIMIFLAPIGMSGIFAFDNDEFDEENDD